MPYTIRLSDGSVITTIADNAIDSTTLPVALLGRGAINYGTDVAENFVWMLENFRSNKPPKNPLVGQLWFDSGTTKLRYYVAGQWLEIAQGTPSSLNVANTLVLRDGNGNFAANIITANLNGIADSARRWTTPRTLTLSADVTGSVTFDGSANISLPITVNHSTTADRWTTPRTLTLSTDVTGAVTFDGSGNISLPIVVNHSTTADRWTTARTFTLSGSILGSATINGAGDINLNTTFNTSGGAQNGVVPITVSKALNADNATNAQNAVNAQAATNATYAQSAANAQNAYNAGQAQKLAQARLIQLTGAVVGQAYFDGAYDINIATTSTTGGVPIGTIVPIATVNAPAGYLPLYGGVISRYSYPDLWNFAANSGMLTDEGTWGAGYFGYFTTGDGSSNFRLPDVRGTFLRAYDQGRGLDPDRGGGLLGWLQRDQLKNHQHYTAHGAFYFITVYAAAGPANIVYDNQGNVPTTYGYDYLPAGGGGNETRPVNITYNYYIRAY